MFDLENVMTKDCNGVRSIWLSLDSYALTYNSVTCRYNILQGATHFHGAVTLSNNEALVALSASSEDLHDLKAKLESINKVMTS